MRAIRKVPGEDFELIEVENTLEALQKEVGGHIECVQFSIGSYIICNEEGRLRDLPYNVNINGIPYVGTILIVGTDDEDFTDVPFDEEFFR